MVTYRLIGTNFDVIIRTDASDDQKEFFITEIEGLNSVEVEAGFDINVEQYNEGQLITFAIEKNLGLYSYDTSRGERTLATAGVPEYYGIFNGTDSQLDIPFVSSRSGSALNGEVTLNFKLLLTESDIAAAAVAGTMYIISYSASGIYFETEVDSSTASTITLDYFVGLDDGVSGQTDMEIYGDTLNSDTWYDFKIVANPTSVELFINEVSKGSEVGTILVPDSTFTNPLDIGVNFGGTNFTAFSIDEIVFTAQSGAITAVDIKDPSTGVNDGTDADGTAVNVAQGTL